MRRNQRGIKINWFEKVLKSLRKDEKQNVYTERITRYKSIQATYKKIVEA